MPRDLIELYPSGRLVFHFHSGQVRAWNAQERIVAIIAGTQSGKTSFGSLWIHREIQKAGPGDYLIAAPTFRLLELKLLGEFERLFVDYLKLGTMVKTPVPRFTTTPEGERRLFGSEQDRRTVVHFGHAQDPNSLESMTAKAAWLDEAGQEQFKVGSYEAVMRRLSLAQGRLLLTTTPYFVGWLKTRIFDKRYDPTESIRVVQFRSTENPNFPQAEYERARRDLPPWRFKMMYEGEFSRPAGLIYDNFDTLIHTVPRFMLPDRWIRYVGMDFGGVNTVAVFYAEEPGTNRLFCYRTYKAGGRTAKQHVAKILEPEPMIPVAFGGAPSEDQWRDEMKAGGLPVKRPIVGDVEIGIDRVYAQHSASGIIYFDDLDDILTEKANYPRKVDDNGEPTEVIANKNEFHHMDGERYVISSIRGTALQSGYTPTLPTAYRSDVDDPRRDLSPRDRRQHVLTRMGSSRLP